MSEGPSGSSGADRIRVVVHGQVQGVFFRDSCRREASSRGVAGWVANRPDGAVEAVFEGDPEAVQAMLDWCRRGPRGADVDSVEESREDPEGLSRFEIR
jgi:acylphosphatase